MSKAAVIKLIPVASVVVPAGRRSLGDLTSLTESIRAVGLLNPITVTTNKVLVAGLHRLMVFKNLEREEILANILSLDDIDAQLAEIDENLIRNELTVLERSRQLVRRKALYLAKYPQTKSGGSPSAGKGKGKRPRCKDGIIPSFQEDTAKKAKVSRSTVEQETKIGQDILEDVATLLDTTPLADKKVDLLHLSRLDAETQRAVAEKIVAGEAKTVRAAHNLLQGDAIRAEPPPLPEGPFRVLVVDPPWSYSNRPEDTTHRAANAYASMSLEEIAAFPVASLAHEDAILWLWTTNAHLEHAFGIARSWGFEPKTILTWVKDHFGTGDWLRGQTEHCLLAVKGTPVRTLTNQSTVIHGPLREHSRKPDQFYEMVETLCPAPEKGRIDFFSRQARKGWIQYGNQTAHFQP